MAVPTPSASCGLPVTVTGIWKPTCTEIVSSAVYVLSAPASLAITTASTAGTVVAPSTLWAAAFAIAFAPSPSAAFVPVPLRIVPPFSVSAPAATLIPPLSASVARTV